MRAIGARNKARISRLRGCLLRLLLLILSPVLLLTILEAGLRVSGYGYPSGFFLERHDGKGGARHVTNNRFGWRFFPRELARAPHPYALTPKPAGVTRIFVLGGSAAMGTPEPSFSFGNILAVLLRERFPDARFEVVNGAMVAINSHVVREIARDCAALEPDLFIVYMGNNEVVGPYGPGTVFQQWMPPRWMIRASLRAQATRTGQLLRQLVSRLPGKSNRPALWRGMEMFLENPVAADDPRLAKTYEYFRRNLADVFEIAGRTGAPVVLSTVAVNLRDCPPFASQHGSDLGPDARMQWERAYRAGSDLMKTGRLEEALHRYEAAAAMDDRHAGLQFRLGQCLLAVDRVAEAQSRFESARDLDVLRFRADARINGIVREAAAERETVGVHLADAERNFGEQAFEFGAVSAVDLFYEHVHLTFDGNYLLARVVADQLCEAMPRLCEEGRQGTFPTREHCAESLVYTPWDESRMLSDMVKMTSAPPFTNQADHDALQAEARQRLDELRARATAAEAMEEGWRTYERAIARTPGNGHLHQRFGRFAMVWERFDVALEHFQAAAERLPWDSSMHNEFGVALSGLGRVEEARPHFLEALALRPHNLEARNNLGLLLAGSGDIEGAGSEYRKALALDPKHAQTHANLGHLAAARGRVDEAVAHYSKALETDAGNARVVLGLGDAMLALNRVDEAMTHYRKALQIEPAYVQAHNNLGLLLANRGRVDEAIAHYRRALDIDPDHAESHTNLGLALAGRGQVDEAIVHYREALALNPRSADAYNNYGVALISGRGQVDEAIACFEKALEINPAYEGARRNLERARSLRESP